MSLIYQVDDITIHRIIEMESAFLPIADFLPAVTPELLDENRSWLSSIGALSSEDWAVLCFQSYVIRTPHHVILIDSCVGNDKTSTRAAWHQRSDTTYMTALAAAGLSVEDIDFVLCTHLHADHVGWNTQLLDGRWVPTFPRARYVFSKAELDFWIPRHAAKPIPCIAESVLPVVEAGRAELVKDDHALGDHVRLLPTPGHTPHHVGIAIGLGRDSAVFTGDLIHSPLQARYPGLGTAFDLDVSTGNATRRAFLERYAETGTLCCTSHFPSPSVGRIVRRGGGFECAFVE